MKKDALIRLAKRLNVDYTPTKNNLMVCCPFAYWNHKSGKDSTPSMSLQINPYGRSAYHCFGCDEQGADIENMLLRLAGLGMDYAVVGAGLEIVRNAEIEAWDATYEEVQKPTQFVSLFTDPPQDIQIVTDETLDKVYPRLYHPYLWEKRGVTEESAALWDIRFDKDRQRVFLPVRWHHGSQCVGAIGRHVEDDNPKPYYNYFNFPKSRILYGEHLLTHDPVVVCEGPFDAIKVRQAGFNAVSVMGAKFSDEQVGKLVQFGQPVVVFFDNDETGLREGRRLGRELRDRGVEILVVFPPVGTDAGNCPEDLIVKLIAPLVAIRAETEEFDIPLYWQ